MANVNAQNVVTDVVEGLRGIREELGWLSTLRTVEAISETPSSLSAERQPYAAVKDDGTEETMAVGFRRIVTLLLTLEFTFTASDETKGRDLLHRIRRDVNYFLATDQGREGWAYLTDIDYTWSWQWDASQKTMTAQRNAAVRWYESVNER